MLGIYYSLHNFWRANQTLWAIVRATFIMVVRFVGKVLEVAREAGEGMGLLAVKERQGAGVLQQAAEGMQDTWVGLGRTWRAWTKGELVLYVASILSMWFGVARR